MSLRSALLAVLLLAFSLSPGLFAQSSTSPQTSSPHKTSLKKKTVAHSHARKKKRAKLTAAQIRRMRRMNRAFVASSTLKPMAKQLLDMRSKPAYDGVEAYARRHAASDEGAMANLVIAYAHIQDREYAQALPYLKKAQSKSGELADYVAYFTAVCQNGSGDARGTTATLADFRTKYPNSIFAREAAVLDATALLTSGHPKDAIAVAGEVRTPPRADLELTLGRAYLQAGETEKGIAVLRRIYYSMPLSPEAQAASLELGPVQGLPGSFAERKIRADLLAQGRQYRDAAKEYADLIGAAPTVEQRDALQVAMAMAQYRSGDLKNAKQTLESMTLTGDANAQRYYFLSDIARDSNDEDSLNQYINNLRQVAPTSAWFEQSLLSAGNHYLLKPDYDRAIDFYRELDQRFPKGRWGHYAHWKAAWLSLRQNRIEEARKGFEDQITLYPDSAEVPPALYWAGRLAEQQSQLGRARAYYTKLIERFPNYYYADRARGRLDNIGQVTAIDLPLLDHIPPIKIPGKFEDDVPEDDLRVQKAHLLENCAMFDYAVKELQAAASDEGSSWAAAEIARIYQDAGGYNKALNYMKHTVPTYFALDVSALPKSYWEVLFPKAYWNDLTRYSRANELDPYLVASLIRQESEFNAGAISRANALGLMQVMPGTGKKLAKEEHIRRFSTEQLLIPATNIQLGTRFFKELLDQFNGRPEYALAAYNAGSDRVQSWLAQGNFHDPEEFVESIPFTETREYVQAIMRNATVYKKIYQP